MKHFVLSTLSCAVIVASGSVLAADIVPASQLLPAQAGISVTKSTIATKHQQCIAATVCRQTTN